MKANERLRYPGDATGLPASCGALRPEASLSLVLDSTTSARALPQFARRIAGAPMRGEWTLVWPNLSRDEADLLVRDYQGRGRRGTRRITYTPDDGTRSITGLVLRRPTVRRATANTYSVTLTVREQR